MKDVILGISAFGHDTASCLVHKSSGEVIYAAAEERLTNIKHDSHFPIGTIKKCQKLAFENQFNITDVAVRHLPVQIGFSQQFNW